MPIPVTITTTDDCTARLSRAPIRRHRTSALAARATDAWNQRWFARGAADSLIRTKPNTIIPMENSVAASACSLTPRERPLVAT